MTVPDDVETFAEAVGPRPDGVLREMDDRAAETGFPTVGPAVGGWLQQLAGLVGAERVFEFGSGFGYSAYWFARGLPADGEVVLTEVDADELADAREYVARGDFGVEAHFELGDAIETVEEYEGPFDVVLVDNEKDHYVEALAAVSRSCCWMAESTLSRTVVESCSSSISPPPSRPWVDDRTLSRTVSQRLCSRFSTWSPT